MAINTNTHSTHTHTHITSIQFGSINRMMMMRQLCIDLHDNQEKNFFHSSIIIQYTIWVKKKTFRQNVKMEKINLKTSESHTKTHTTHNDNKNKLFSLSFSLSFSIMHTNRKMKFSFHQMYLVMTINVMFWVSFLPVCICL